MALINSHLSALSLEKILEKISEITLQIQQCQDLEDILQWVINDARALLKTDRVLIGQVLENREIIVAYESVSPEWKPTLGQAIFTPCPDTHWLSHYQQGEALTIADLHDGITPPDDVEYLERLQVKAHLVVPIFSQSNLWGLLIAHHCHSSRQWNPLDVQYLEQMALHLSLAVQQHCLVVKRPLESKPLPLPDTNTDITKPNQSDDQLRNLSDRLNLAVKAANLGIWDWDMVKDHLTWNDSLYALYGIQPSAFGGTHQDWEAHIHPADLPTFRAVTQQALVGNNVSKIEFRVILPDGTVRYLESYALLLYAPNGQPIRQIGVSLDISDRKITEVALREQQQFTEQIAESTLAILYVYDLTEQRNIYCNRQIETVLGYSSTEIQAMGDALFPLLIHPDDLPRVIENQQELLRIQDNEFVEIEYRMRHKTGSYRWLLSRGRVLNRTANGHPKHIVGVGIDITAFKEAQAARYQQTERERLLMAIAQKIRQTLDLEQILHTAVTEVQQLLQVDRVVIYRFAADWSGRIIAESVAAGWQSILGRQITDIYLVQTQGQIYQEGQITAIDDIHTAGLDTASMELLEQVQVQAVLVVPILQNEHLWGLLVAHHCQAPRSWEPFEIALQQQLATQIAIAIQQSELYGQVQRLNANLELEVQERTVQLQQALDFEALLKRITDRVRDSLDERQILQTAVQELAIELEIECCDAALYDLEHHTATISYEFIRSGVTPAKGLVFSMNSSAGIHDQLLQGQCIQFCLTNYWTNSYRSTIDHCAAILSCPIQNEQGVIGDLWLFKPQQEYFNDLEVRLVQQVANQCAIALRQSRLYQTAQAQVQELERLNHLKDDFLSTVSHELRSPMSNIKMATQMLEISLNQLGILADESHPVHRYFNVLREEGRREISLINDLLDLTRLDAGTEPLSLIDIDLQIYIPHLAESFLDRMQQQQQRFVVQIPPDLPPCQTDLQYLERILTELLHNACKYTPAGELITVSVRRVLATIELCISNSGVEISPIEQERIFDKFYRIPNNDPWKHGGTGLGLALVKKLVEHLHGQIAVESGSGLTQFIIQLPLGMEL